MRVCQVCGKGLTGSQAKFCGRECFYASMRRVLILTCPQCGKKFERHPWETRAHKVGSYCSPECWEQSRKGKPRPEIQVEPEDRTCPVCGTHFQVGGRGRPSRDAVFCSVRCQNLGRYRKGNTSVQLSDVDSAYIAGLVDGEGSIMLFWRRDTVAIRMTVTNTVKSALDWLQEVCQVGRIQSHRKEGATRYKPTWAWMLNGDGAISVLRQIRPYMRMKAAQAYLAIETQERLREPTLKADRIWQLEYKQKMQVLNRRGQRGSDAS